MTKFFFVRNIGAIPLNVGFTANGVLGSNKFTLLTSQSFQGDIRVKDLFLASSGAASFEVVAGLTGIQRKNFPVLTGSLISSLARLKKHLVSMDLAIQMGLADQTFSLSYITLHR